MAKLNISQVSTENLLHLGAFTSGNIIPDHAAAYPVPAYVLHNIVLYHLNPLNMISRDLKIRLLVYRGYQHAIKPDGLGNPHNYGVPDSIHNNPSHPVFRGATDIKISPVSYTPTIFGDLAVELTRYKWTRLCINLKSNHIHMDYMAERKEFFITDEEHTWRPVIFEDYWKAAEKVTLSHA